MEIKAKKLTLIQVNEKLQASILGIGSLDSFVDVYYDGFEELKDGFQVSDVFSLAASLTSAYSNKEMVRAEAMDLQDNEIISLISRADNFNLGDLTTEAKQLLKWLLVSLQTYNLLIYEKRD